MLLKEIKKSLFPLGAGDRVTPSSDPRGATGYPGLIEPSIEIRAAVRRRTLGLPHPSSEKPGPYWVGPAGYEVYPVHRRVSMRGGLASSDALVVTRFLFSGADQALNRLLGKSTEGLGVLDLDLGGLELAWQSDLMRALEDRSAIWSVSRILQSSGDVVLEHLALPCRTEDGRLVLAGWFHRIGGSHGGDPEWSDVSRIRREHRCQRISSPLGDEQVPDMLPTPDRPPSGDRVSELRAKGGL